MKAVGMLQVKPTPTHVKKNVDLLITHSPDLLNSTTIKAKASAPCCELNPSGITHLQHKTKVFKDSDGENSNPGLGI